MDLGRCPGCGQELPVIDGAMHAYVGASSACWTRFAELGATLPPGGTADAIETYVRGVWDSWAPHWATVAQWAQAAGVG